VQEKEVHQLYLAQGSSIVHRVSINKVIIGSC
jgi:hypothetical protein